ncbi:MAG: hypothetical protein KGL39_14160 [Patescibacteria group bacterium]|nr:hypothetical protein [Patescibacteria group bacterium]
MARTIESTTDSQADLEKAFGKEETETKPAEQAAAAETETQEGKQLAGEFEEAIEAAGDETDASGSEEEAYEAESQARPQEKKHKPSKGFQKRIDKLTKEKYQLEARIAEFERQRQEQAAQVQQRQQVQQQAQAQPQGKPTLDQFQSYDAYVEALADWKFQERQAQAQREAAQRTQVEAAQKQQQEFKERFDSYRERVNAAATKYEDWDDVTSKNVIVPESASLAIIDSEQGPDITYFLGKHPEVVDELHEMTPTQQIARIAVIGYELAHPKAPKVTTKAPAPVQPVGGSAQGNTMPANPSYRDYRRKWLEEQNA